MGSIVGLSTFEPEVQATGQQALGYMLDKSPMLRLLEQKSAFELDATDFDFIVATQAASLQTRARAGGYTPAAMTVGSRTSLSQKFHGDAVEIDIADIKDSKLGLRQVDMMLEKKTRQSFQSFAKLYDAQLFQGTGATTTLTGLETLMNGTDDLPGHTGIKGFESAAAASSFLSAKSFNARNPANYRRFEEYIMAKLLEVPDANAIIMNNAFFILFATIGKALNSWSLGVDSFGKNVINFGNLSVYPMLNTSITNTEENSDNSGTDSCTSIYIARLGEGSMSLVTNSGLEMNAISPDGTMEKGFKYEIRAAWKIEEPDACKRLAHFDISSPYIAGTASVDFNINFLG